MLKKIINFFRKKYVFLIVFNYKFVDSKFGSLTDNIVGNIFIECNIGFDKYKAYNDLTPMIVEKLKEKFDRIDDIEVIITNIIKL